MATSYVHFRKKQDGSKVLVGENWWLWEGEAVNGARETKEKVPLIKWFMMSRD